LNLSAGGAFILTPKPLPLRRHFCIKFILPEIPDEPVRAFASVVWTPAQSKSNKHPMGMGVEFEFSEPRLIHFLDQYVTVQSGLRSLDSRIGKELPIHLRSELTSPKN